MAEQRLVPMLEWLKDQMDAFRADAQPMAGNVIPKLTVSTAYVYGKSSEPRDIQEE